MKKLFFFAVALFCMTTAFAGTYAVQVCGVQVTDDNKTDVLGDGKVSYQQYPGMGMLNLSDVNLTSDDNLILIGTSVVADNEVPGRVVVCFNGACTFKCTQMNKFIISAVGINELSLGVYGKVNMTSEGYGISSGADLLITSGGSLSVTSAQRTIHAFRKLTLNNVALWANCTSTNSNIGAMHIGSNGEKELVLNNEYEVYGSTYNSSMEYVCDGTNPAKIVRFLPEEYDIIVDGQPLTKDNYLNFFGDGTIAFNPWDLTLSLKNLNLDNTSSSNAGIMTTLDLNIQVSGNCTIASKAEALYCRCGRTKIAGLPNASLTCTSLEDAALILECNATIQRITVNAFSSGTYGYLSDFSSMTLDNCYLNVYGPKASIYWVDDWFTDNVKLDANHSWTNSMFVSNANPTKEATDTVHFMPAEKYDIYVDGMSVNELNATDILGNGTLSFDVATNCLTLNNCDIRTTKEPAIRIGRPITVRLVGNNSLVSEENSGLWFYNYSGEPCSVAIEGDGKLYLEAPNNDDYQDLALYMQYVDCTIRNTTITALGASGISGEDASVTIENSTIVAEGAYYGSIESCAVTLVGCEIVTPADATIGEDGVYLDGDFAKQQVKIEPITLGVTNAAAPAPADGVKRIEDGHLVIYKNGKRYNLLGISF